MFIDDRPIIDLIAPEIVEIANDSVV